MTDFEAFKWIVDNFKETPRDFADPIPWDKLNKAVDRYKLVYPKSPYNDLLETYIKSLYEVASIDYIINVKGGLPKELLHTEGSE